jgi:hypothetical protein
MGQVAGPQDGWKILEALGFTEDRKISKAVIVLETGRPVIVRVREFAQPFNVVGDELEMLTKRYELVERKEPREYVLTDATSGMEMKFKHGEVH